MPSLLTALQELAGSTSRQAAHAVDVLALVAHNPRLAAAVVADGLFATLLDCATPALLASKVKLRSAARAKPFPARMLRHL